MRRTHPPRHIRFDGLAVEKHCSAPSGTHGRKSGRDGEASTFLAEEAGKSNGNILHNLNAITLSTPPGGHGIIMTSLRKEYS